MSSAEITTTPAMQSSIKALAEDVHDTWRSTLTAGTRTVFEPDIVRINNGNQEQELDLASTKHGDLPDSVKNVSERTAFFILNMLAGYVEMAPSELSSMRIEKMAIMLFTMWDFMKNPRDMQSQELNDRLGLFPCANQRVRVLDRRLIIAGVATDLDEKRYPVWQQYDIAAVQSIAGVRRYDQKGRDMLERVRNGSTVPLNSETDDLTEGQIR